MIFFFIELSLFCQLLKYHMIHCFRVNFLSLTLDGRPSFCSLSHAPEHMKVFNECVGGKKWWTLYKEMIRMTSDFKTFQALFNDFHPLHWPLSGSGLCTYLPCKWQAYHLLSRLAQFSFTRSLSLGRPLKFQILMLLWDTLTVPYHSLLLERCLLNCLQPDNKAQSRWIIIQCLAHSIKIKIFTCIYMKSYIFWAWKPNQTKIE